MTIIEDTRQQASKHEIKHKYFEENGINILRSKLPIGDYARLDNLSLVIDTKKDIQELILDVTKDHERFK
jgi:ribosome-associated protein